MKNFFLVPGRLISKFFGGDKKRTLRSPRNRAEASAGQIVLSLVFWLALVGIAVLATDGFGFLGGTPESGVPKKTAVAPKAEAVIPVAPKQEAIIGDLGTAPVAPKPTPAELVGVEQWLVILHTIPKSGRDEAERRQSSYRTKGLGVDIFDTDAFPRLRSGSWIIALGPFEDRANAYRVAEEAKRFNSGLIVRRGL